MIAAAIAASPNPNIKNTTFPSLACALYARAKNKAEENLREQDIIPQKILKLKKTKKRIGRNPSAYFGIRSQYCMTQEIRDELRLQEITGTNAGGAKFDRLDSTVVVNFDRLKIDFKGTLCVLDNVHTDTAALLGSTPDTFTRKLSSGCSSQ